MSTGTWRIYQGSGEPHAYELPVPPPWRVFTGEVDETQDNNDEQGGSEELKRDQERGRKFIAREKEIDLVNAALLLRRPLLVTGRPGFGKSSLAYAVAYELNLGRVLRWPITTRSMLSDGLYHYDAIARLYDISVEKEKDAEKESKLSRVPKYSKDIGQYIHLGPLGTALLPSEKPRVLLIDEIDKSDIDLPNDLLHVFEEGSFDIPEVSRYAKKTGDDLQEPVFVYPWDCDRATARIMNRKVRCHAFPFIVLTSNDEREFPPAFLRRCIRLEMKKPELKDLERIVGEHLGEERFNEAKELVATFDENRKLGDVATDQLLNAIYLKMEGVDSREKKDIFEAILRPLNQG